MKSGIIQLLLLLVLLGPSLGCREKRAEDVVKERNIVGDDPMRRGGSWTNTLGMIFRVIPGTSVRFCVWETRVQDYEIFAKSTDRDWKRADFPETPNCPAVNVSWDDAKAFCAWLTHKELMEVHLQADEIYRLPTDAEWSLAAGLNEETATTPKDKSGKVKRYSWGTIWPPPSRAGNFADLSAKAKHPSWVNINYTVIPAYDDSFPETSPVGSFKPNESGLYDISGNVEEWCEDWINDSQKLRVLRGGSWMTRLPDTLLLSYRGGFTPDVRVDFCGFRVVVAKVK